MAIRRTDGRTPQTNRSGGADPQQALAALKKELAKAVAPGPGSSHRLSEDEARSLIQKAEAGGPDVVKAFQAEVAEALSAGKVGDQALALSDTTRGLLQDFSGAGAAGGASGAGDGAQATGNGAGDTVALKEPEDLAESVRDAVGKKAAERLINVVTQHKDVEGTGQEAAAKGDPRVTQRRSALGTLLANRTSGMFDLDTLKGLSPKVENDIKWLMAADRSEYQTDGTKEMFGWAKSNMAGADKIYGTFQKRVAKQTEQAKKLDAGEVDAYDVSDNSVVGLSLIQDGDKRASALVDTLLQFRARTDKANQQQSYGGFGSGGSTRADEIAPGLIAEQRILLAAAKLGLDDPAKVREYALLREVIASHPTSSVNGIFEARNAVGKIFMDGASSYSGKDHATAWIKEETAPGATASAYSAIHHNFSRDTPGNIQAIFDNWVFPTGPKERRAQVFLALVDAQAQAERGDVGAAREYLKEHLTSKDKETLKDLLPKLEQAPDEEFATNIRKFLVETSEKPLATDAQTALEVLLKKAKDRYSYGFNDAVNNLSPGLKEAFKPLLDDLKNASGMPQKAELIQKFIDDNKDTQFPDTNVATNLDYFARLYRSVCADQPSADTLEQDLFKAGPAWKEVADVVAQLRADNNVGALKDLGEARLALRDAVVGSDKGFERHELIKFDADVSRLTNTELGAAVDRVGTCKTDGQKAECMVAVQTALRSAVASGLHELKAKDDPAADKIEGLDQVLADVDKALDSGKIDEADYRSLMSRVYVAVAATVQNIRSFVDHRAPDVAELGAELDPEFLDQFVKQSPLHYATALSEKGMRAGLEEEIGPRCVKNVEGMRVLNSVGPVVFDSVYFAENTKELVDLKPPKDAMTVVYGLEEKKMVAVGGLIVDNEHAPGGNSHLNMYAMNNGITVLALPELRTKYAELFENAKNEGGLYVDDSNGEFQMMTVDYAIEQGIITKKDAEQLGPGFNRKISYLQSKGVGDGFDKIGYHEVDVSPERKTREIELYVPMDEVDGIGRKCTSFSDLAKLGIHARHLAGEKGTVLALLKSNPKLQEYVPDGSMVTTGRCRKLLEDAGIWKDWDAIWQNDPKVGVVDDSNFLKSEFYSNPDYRAEKRQHLQDLTKDTLTEFLIEPKDQDGRPSDVSEKDVKLMANQLARFDGEWPYEKAEYNPGGKSVKGDDAFKKEVEEQFGKPLDEIRELVDKYAPTLTDAGKELYDELRDNPAMADSDNWITRSSFTGEDRPGKSGAGQYESFFHLKDPVSRIDGVVGVMESTWMPEPIENNVADEVNLQHIMPSIVVQHCLQPSESGVMISRDIEHGSRGKVSYQLVKGFGGGVEGGKTEEGVISTTGHTTSIKHPDAPDGLVPADQMGKLREIVLETEKYFNEVVEAGQGFAVDMEVARVDDTWNVVQARVIQLDK